MPPSPKPTEDNQHIVVIGSGGVGKSCLTVRFLKNEFTNEYDPTIEENYRKTVTVDGKSVTLNLVDTAGQQEYTALRDQHLTAGEGFVLVFSILDRLSFEEAKKLHESITKLKERTKFPIVVLGNKCDMENSRVVTKNEAQQWAQSIKAPYLETSAKENINVIDGFHTIVREIWKDKSKKKGKDKKKGGCLLM